MKHTNTRNFLVTLLPLFAMMAGLSACTPVSDDSEKADDPTKAHLTIGTLDAGIGGKWIEEAAARFEELYKDSTDFEEGKIGVNISVSARRTYDGTFLLNQNWNQDIMFTEAINYYALANSGKIRDITDLMNADLSRYADPAGTTILSKIDPSYASFLNKDGKYYGIPFYESFYGFVYDVDLWKQDGLYFKDGGGFTKDKNAFAAGPDGKKGTYDDGMPATYADFSTLMNRLVTDYGRAFVISTDEHEYMANLLFNFWANEEGYDGMNLQYKLSSEEAGGATASNLIQTFDGDNVSSYYPKTTITHDNAYLLQRSQAKYNALSLFASSIVPSKYYGDLKNKNTDCQSFFIESRLEADTACPMCVEGSWFENEASGVLDSMETKYGSRGNYALMPIPWSSADKVGSAPTRLGLSSSYAMINANCKNTKLAYEFLKFLHSDAELLAFTKSTGMTRPLSYDIPDAEVASLSTYTKSLINAKNNSKIFYPYANNQIALNHYDDFSYCHWAWNRDVNNLSYVNPWTYFRDSAVSSSDKTAKTYFDGCYDHFQKNWSGYLR